MKEPFEEIAAALEEVTTIAERLPGEVRSSARELKEAFTHHDSVEPAVSRLQNSVSKAAHGSAGDEAIVTRLDTAIEEQLLPELRRVGFDV